VPDSAVLTFADPDAYHAGFRGLQVEGIVTARGEYRSELTRIDLHRLWMQRGDESLPRVVASRRTGSGRQFLLATDRNQPAMHINGMAVSESEIALHGVSSLRHSRSSAACRWGALALTQEDLAAAGQALIGREFIAPSMTDRIRPPAPLLSRLRNLHESGRSPRQDRP